MIDEKKKMKDSNLLLCGNQKFPSFNNHFAAFFVFLSSLIIFLSLSSYHFCSKLLLLIAGEMCPLHFSLDVLEQSLPLSTLGPKHFPALPFILIVFHCLLALTAFLFYTH